MIQNRLNHRPRKVLNYRTPYEVFFKEFARKCLLSLGGNCTYCLNWRSLDGSDWFSLANTFDIYSFTNNFSWD